MRKTDEADAALADIERVARKDEITRGMRLRLLWDVGVLEAHMRGLRERSSQELRETYMRGYHDRMDGLDADWKRWRK